MKIIILLVITFIAYAIIENCFLLVVRREKIGNGMRIAHISDLHKRHFGKCNDRLCHKTEKENPDLIIISGDLVSRTETDFSCARETLKKLCEIAPIYMILGNHEQSLPDERLKEFLKAVSETDVILLKNEIQSIELNGRFISIAGLEPAYTTYKKDGGYRNLDIVTPDEMHKLMGKKPDGETLLIAHNPLFAEAYSQWGADYIFSGHVHGGAVMIPFTNVGVLSPERKFLPKYSKGIYTLGKSKLLVSGGLGKLRIFNPPEIVIYEI